MWVSGTVFLVVLSAAVLHAVWNALVKGGSDKHLGMAAVILGHVPFALVVLLFVPPPAPASWPYIALSMALHLGYQFFLRASFRIVDPT